MKWMLVFMLAVLIIFGSCVAVTVVMAEAAQHIVQSTIRETK